jgi:hypothetical protein
LGHRIFQCQNNQSNQPQNQPKQTKDTKDNTQQEKAKEKVENKIVEESNEKIEVVKKYEEEKTKIDDNIKINTNVITEEGKTEEQKKKKRKRNRKKKNKDDNQEGENEDEDDEEEKKKEEEELKKLKENKYKSFWDTEFSNAKIINTRAQDNSIFRVLKNWQEIEGWKQTYLLL